MLLLQMTKDQKMQNEANNLVWIDLEMTGLDPQKDRILEIAAIITDGQLNEVAQGPVIAISCPEENLEQMNDWVREVHSKSGLLDQVRASQISLEQAETETFNFISSYCVEKKAILAGNSVWQDKFFMVRHMPSITNYLHYRILDVSSVRSAITRWYPGNEKTVFPKSNNHRALEDIRESIAELKHYRTYFFV